LEAKIINESLKGDIISLVEGLLKSSQINFNKETVEGIDDTAEWLIENLSLKKVVFEEQKDL